MSIVKIVHGAFLVDGQSVKKSDDFGLDLFQLIWVHNTHDSQQQRRRAVQHTKRAGVFSFEKV